MTATTSPAVARAAPPLANTVVKERRTERCFERIVRALIARTPRGMSTPVVAAKYRCMSAASSGDSTGVWSGMSHLLAHRRQRAGQVGAHRAGAARHQVGALVDRVTVVVVE